MAIHQLIPNLTNLTVTPPALTYMSGMMSTPMSWRILSAAGVMGPFAASAIILALMLAAFPKRHIESEKKMLNA